MCLVANHIATREGIPWRQHQAERRARSNDGSSLCEHNPTKTASTDSAQDPCTAPEELRVEEEGVDEAGNMTSSEQFEI